MDKKETNLAEIEKETFNAVNEALENSQIGEGDIFVIGCSSSEVSGGIIGQNSNEAVGKVIIKTALKVLKDKRIFLAVQCCEHLNRALVIEKAALIKYGFEEVSAVPLVNAGGACAAAAYAFAENPVLAEHIYAHAGIDIGDTEIGMHIKFVQVPVRLKNNTIGNARVTALKSRPKLIGGKRAVYKS